jgi:maltose alpha-D-glucosyltransferase/alpha-amylase
VFEAVQNVLTFWLDLGVDGFRLDAIPYLIEREGTDCEGLPETHEILRRLRKTIDDHYQDRILLAEANQWPQEMQAYFGDDDECHMAFHFPLMPRLFLGLSQADRRPIVDILKQTPELSPNCQWATFLRNHDELTLEKVTDEERTHMYSYYAAVQRMRINLGIRRRLSPLLGGVRPRIELMNALLLSLIGSPVIYYGDEIGMGDNVFLGDRNTVRTPMQWNADRHGGFSSAEFERLYAPPNLDPPYGYTFINVAAQRRDPTSQLHWMRRALEVRKQHPAFGWGSLELLHPENRTVFAFLRAHREDQLLVVANLSMHAQPVHLDLSRFAGRTPLELFGRTEFPTVTDDPYFLSLSPYAFYWFALPEPGQSSEDSHD